MKILYIARQVGQRNESQQSCSGRVNAIRGNRVIRERRVGGGIEDLHRQSRVGAAADGCAGKVAVALGQRGHGGKLVKRILAHIASVIKEVKSLVATLIDFGNVQGPAEVSSKAILKIIRFGAGLAAE